MTNHGTVLILYNAPDGGASSFVESETGVLDQVRAVAVSLVKLGIPHREIGLRSLKELPAALSVNPAGVAMNLVEGFPNSAADALLVPTVCRVFGVEVTGNDTLCLTLSTDKMRTKALLAAAGLRCPAGVTVPVGQNIPSSDLPSGLCIVKPAAADGSEGIDADSVTESADPQLKERVRTVHERFNQPAIIEEMIGRREINVSLLQVNNEIRVLPLAEIDFSAFSSERPRIVGYAAKWKKESFEYSHTPRIFPARVDKAQEQLIRQMALTAWKTLGCRDYVRVDFRLTEEGEPVILELNANPDISPEAGYAAALQEAGISYDDFVRILLDNAAARRILSSMPVRKHSAEVDRALRARSDAAAERGVHPMHRQIHDAEHCVIRRATAQDRKVVLALVNQPEFFRPDELEIAKEVFDEAAKAGEKGHYQSFVLEEDGEVRGWVCYGPTPCTVGTFDVYWIAVAPDCQRRKMGRKLMEFAEAGIRERGGRLAVVETSGRAGYEPTRRFYEKLQYQESARVKDFYAPGDDKIISTKIL